MQPGWIREAPTEVIVAAPSADLVDHDIVEALIDLCDDENPDFFRNLVGEFERHAELRLAEMKHAAAARDGEGLYRSAHSLRGSAGNVGAKHMASLLADLQRVGHEGPLERATGLIERVEGAFRSSIVLLAEAAG